MSEGRTRGTGKPVATVVAVTVLVLAIAASAVASRFIPAAGPTPTESTSPGIGSAGPGPSGTSTIKWFVGLGGTSPARLAAEEAFAARYNASNKDGVILEIDDPRAIDPTADPVTILKTQFSANDGPDIVGPASLGAMSDFDGLWMDLTTEIAKDHVDLGSYDPALLKLAHEPGAYDTTPSGAPLTGIPYAVDPGFIVYNRDLFTRAGLPPLPTTVGQTYQGKTWDWNELAAVAARLTLDTSGRAAGQPGFDPAHIAQFGFDFPTSDARVMASTFGSGSLLAGFCPSDLQIAPTWSDAFSWYYRAIWTRHIAPTMPQQRDLGTAGSMASGRVAMALSFPSEIGTYGAMDGRGSAGWAMAVIPSWKGATTSPVSMQTFQIVHNFPDTPASPSPRADHAFDALIAMEADPSLREAYGLMPAASALQPAWFASKDAARTAVFSGGPIDWSVVVAMEQHAAFPSPEQTLWNRQAAVADYTGFFTSLRSSPHLDIPEELAALRQAIQDDAWAAMSWPNGSGPSDPGNPCGL